MADEATASRIRELNSQRRGVPGDFVAPMHFETPQGKAAAADAERVEAEARAQQVRDKEAARIGKLGTDARDVFGDRLEIALDYAGTLPADQRERVQKRLHGTVGESLTTVKSLLEAKAAADAPPAKPFATALEWSLYRGADKDERTHATPLEVFQNGPRSAY